jgi:hypothetical protein
MSVAFAAGVNAAASYADPIEPSSRIPTAAEFRAAYPRYAVGIGVVQLRCMAVADGGFKTCTVQSEYPTGQGFGLSALRLAAIYRFAWNAASAGHPVDFEIVVMPQNPLASASTNNLFG